MRLLRCSLSRAKTCCRVSLSAAWPGEPSSVCVRVVSYPWLTGLKSLLTLSEGCCSGCLKMKARLLCPQTAELRFSTEKLEKLLLELSLQWRSPGHQKRRMNLFQRARKRSARAEETACVSITLLPFTARSSVSANKLCSADVFTKRETNSL